MDDAELPVQSVVGTVYNCWCSEGMGNLPLTHISIRSRIAVVIL